MFSLVQELMKTRHELRELKEQICVLQWANATLSSNNYNIPVSSISLFVQYNGFFNQLCDIRLTMTVRELLVKLRQLTGIPIGRSICLRVLSEDGLITICFLHKELNRTLESYNNFLKPRMILSIEDNDDNDNYQEKHLEQSKSTSSSKQTYSFDESDV